MARYQSIDAQGVPDPETPASTTPSTTGNNQPRSRGGTTHPSYYDDPAGKPLFGETTRGDRVLNLIVGAFTALFVTVTLICAVALPKWPPRGLNIYFAIVIVLICASHLVLIYWYRQGDLEPRFRSLIYYNAFTIILLCICANLYIHNV